MKVFAVALLSYAAGSISWGFLIGKFNGLDLRRHGSGNLGATNVRRVLGRDWGILCFVLDVLKGLIPVLVGLSITRSSEGLETLIPVIAAGAAVAGHIWPFTLRFKGGKGVATSIGVLLALAPWCVVASTLTWYIVFVSFRYVSLASLCAAIMLPLSALALKLLPWTTVSLPVVTLLVVLALVIVIKHRSNIARLRQGTEYRFAAEKEATTSDDHS